MDKENRLLKLREIALQCANCELFRTRDNLVFGEGPADSFIMFIGEGPGREEDKTGKPFVGRSGKLLRKMIKAIELEEKYYYITNIVKCRPPNNRVPEIEEIKPCIKFLKKQIEIIRPALIVLLGKTAVKGLCPEFSTYSIEKLRSMTKNLGMITYENIPVMVTYHPSALLRTAWRKVGAKEDFIFLKNIFNDLFINET